MMPEQSAFATPSSFLRRSASHGEAEPESGAGHRSRAAIPGNRGALALALLLLASCTPQPPNIVLIISDDHGWMDHGFMGSTAVETPNLDRIASEGLIFTRGYVPTAVCRPSLASIITGLPPHVHRITGNDPPGGNATMHDPAARAEMEALFRDLTTLPEMLGEAGYVSFQSGKWWEGNPLDHGFTEAMTHGDVARGGRHGDDGLKIGREGMQPVFDFIDSTADSPFFLWYAPFLPHTPHNPPEYLVERFSGSDVDPAIEKYHAMIAWFDETVGDLMSHLEQQDQLANTVVIYMVDNGWIQPTGDQRMADSRAKMSPYDAGIRTPIIVHWPTQVPPARDNTTLVSSLDLAPTILETAGLHQTEYMPGRNLLDKPDLASRTALSGALFVHTAANLRDPSANLKYRYAVTSNGWKLILPYLPNGDLTLMIDGSVSDWMRFEPELYNLINDPLEQNNLAAEYPEMVDSLQTEIDHWWTP